MTFGTLPAQFPKRLPLPRVQRSVMHKKQKQDTEATAARQGTYLRNASQVSRPPVAQSPILQLLSHPVALTSGPSADRFPSHTVIKSFSCLLLWLSSRQANQQFGSPTIRSSSHRVVQPSGRPAVRSPFSHGRASPECDGGLFETDRTCLYLGSRTFISYFIMHFQDGYGYELLSIHIRTHTHM